MYGWLLRLNEGEREMILDTLMTWTEGWTLGGLLWAFVCLWGITYCIIESESAFGQED